MPRHDPAKIMHLSMQIEDSCEGLSSSTPWASQGIGLIDLDEPNGMRDDALIKRNHRL